jgi:hypothetical protein
MKKPNINDIRSGVQTGVEFVEPIAKRAVSLGQEALKTKIGKNLAIGAAAGGAIAYALPLMSISTGMILGGGIMMFLKNLDGDPKKPDE